MKKLIVFILFLILVIGFGWKIKRWYSAAVWDGENRINLALLIDKKISLFSLDPWEEKIIFLPLPPSLYLEVTRGYGPYRLEAIFDLGELEKGKGGELLIETLQENFEIPIDGFGIITEIQLSTSNLKSDIVSFLKALLKKGKTNLKKWDLFRLWWKIKKIRQDKFISIEIEKMNILKEVVLGNGEKGFEIDFPKTSQLGENFFKDFSIRQENFSIAVLNCSGYPGLATRGAKLIKNIGGRVVEIKEGEKSPKCELRSPKKLKGSYTLKKLEKIFNCQWKGEELGDSRAQIVLMLGEDYWKKLEEKW